MSRSKPTDKFIVGILLALFFGIALYLRVYLPYDQVFSGDWIKFTGIDAYYQMHFVDNLALNFPHHLNFDPYFIYPSSPGTTSLRFFIWFLGSVTWVIGLGSPTQHTVDVVGVYFPAILGALTVIPVYFIGKELFNRWAGVVAAGLIALTSGEFLGRSILGFTDYHVAEVLFTTVVILFLILATKAARQQQLTFADFKYRNWAKIKIPFFYSLLAGVFLGIYLLTWQGGLLFVFIISVYFIIQFTIDHLKQKSTDYLCLIGIIVFFIAMIMYLPASPPKFHAVSLVIALLIPLLLGGTSWLMARKGIRPAYYPLSLLGIGVVGLGVFYVISSPLLSSMLGAFSIFMPTEVERTTIEMQPFLFPGGDFSTKIAWGNFTTSFFLVKWWPIPGLSLISLGFLIFLIIKQAIKQESVDAEKSLLVVWSVVILAATLGQRRFAYYFAVNVVLLTGYLSVLIYYVIRYIIDYLGNKNTDYMSWRILEFAGFKELIARPMGLPTRAERRRTRLEKGREAQSSINYTSIILWVIVIFFLVFFWNIHWATNTAKQARFAPTDAWMGSLSWLKENTPDPFGNSNFYYELHEPLPPGESYNYPESAYGVTAWWDYGYWISRIAHRLPNANPSQNRVAVTNVASFFLSQDENSADEIIQELDSSYIIIDYLTATGKFWAIATWLEREPTEYFDIYYLPQENEVRQYIYPEYYRSLSVRLYNFDGEAVTPKSTLVISYQERVSDDAEVIKEVTSEKEFDSYEEAEAYLLSQKSPTYRIVGNNPFVSPVPLEALKHYKLIHSSDESITQPSVGVVPEVKIFEYIGR